MIQPKDDQETLLLAKFREKTADLNQDEETSLKFLRAREGDLVKAEDMLRKSVKWRSDNNISQYLHWKLPDKMVNDFRITYECSGMDNEGRPVFYLPFGVFKSKDCIAFGMKEEIPKVAYHILERAVHMNKQNNISQVIFVLDCNHLSMREVIHRESMSVLYSNFQALEQNYPEIIKYLIIINAPKIFSIVFRCIRPILSERTISKIQICDSNKEVWMAELLKRMPRESLPKFTE